MRHIEAPQVYRYREPPLDVPSTLARPPPILDHNEDSYDCILSSIGARDELPLFVLVA